MEEDAEVQACEQDREEDKAEEEKGAQEDLEGSVTVQEDAHLGMVPTGDDNLCQNQKKRARKSDLK